MEKVSIIVPVYNVEEYLDECINSLVNQTMQEIQIILIDDGSTDQSGKMIDDYAVTDSRILALHKKNGGQSSARNFGLYHATGEYILYVDSDDYIALNSCEKLYEAATRFQTDIVQGDILNEENIILEKPLFRKIPSENHSVLTSKFLKEKIETETYDIVPWLYLIRKSLIIRENLSFIEGYTYEDQLYTFQLLTTEATIVKIRFPFYFYRMDRPNSTTNHIVLKRGMDAAFICNEMYRHFLKLPKEHEEENAAVLLISLYQFYNVFLRLSSSDRTVVMKNFKISDLMSKLPNIRYYKELHRQLIRFITHPRCVVFLYDTKRKIRKRLRK